MALEVKAHLFQSFFFVTPIDLVELLGSTYALEEKDRNRLVNGETYRLEGFDQQNGLMLCNFIKIRMEEGPSRAGLNRKAVGFQLKGDEGFGEETAAAYDPVTGLWAVQYNHQGPKAGVIAEYCNILRMPSPGFDLNPKWRKDVMDELRRRGLRTKLSVRLAVASLKDADVEGVAGLNEAIDLARKNAADYVTIELSVDRGRHLGDKVEGWITWWRRWRSGERNKAVERFVVTAKGEGLKSKEINLIEPRVEESFQLKAGKDRLLPLQQRWDFLTQALNNWRSSYR